MLVIFCTCTCISNYYILLKRKVVEKLLWETSLAVRSVKIETETGANLRKRYPGIIIYVSTRSTQVKHEYRQCQFICFDFGVSLKYMYRIR